MAHPGTARPHEGSAAYVFVLTANGAASAGAAEPRVYPNIFDAPSDNPAADGTMVCVDTDMSANGGFYGGSVAPPVVQPDGDTTTLLGWALAPPDGSRQSNAQTLKAWPALITGVATVPVRILDTVKFAYVGERKLWAKRHLTLLACEPCRSAAAARPGAKWKWICSCCPYRTGSVLLR